jgi:hypothetical protein
MKIRPQIEGKLASIEEVSPDLENSEGFSKHKA